MWKLTIIDGHGGVHNFENEELDYTAWDAAVKWGGIMEGATNTYVNHGGQGEIPTTITSLVWID